MQMQGRLVWCTWTSEPCNPASCNYAICVKRRILPNGVCASSIRRRTREDEQPEDLLKDELKVRGKLLRKTGEKKIFL